MVSDAIIVGTNKIARRCLDITKTQGSKSQNFGPKQQDRADQAVLSKKSKLQADAPEWTSTTGTGEAFHMAVAPWRAALANNSLTRRSSGGFFFKGKIRGPR